MSVPPPTVPSPTALARVCTLFATTQCPGYSPLYETLSLGLAGDGDLLDLLAQAPAGQARPTLLLAAVHYLLLGGVDHPLARFYPSVSSAGHALPDGGAGDAVAAFRSFCHDHRPELVTLIKRGRTQTNDVRRAAALVVALQEIARLRPMPMALIEAGSSAGLHLLYPRYRYRLGATSLGDPFSPVDVTVSVDHSLEAALDPLIPEARSVTGIDVAPLDVWRPDDVRWLRSFVWPELSDDAHRLLAAVDLARSSPPEVIEGDALDVLPELLAGLDGDVLPVVFHSTLLTYLSGVHRARLFALLAAVGARRPLAWIALESPGLLTGPDGVDLGAAGGDNAGFVLTVVVWDDGGVRTTIPLAHADPYGRSLRSLRTPTPLS